MIQTKHNLISALFDLDEQQAGEATNGALLERVQRMLGWIAEVVTDQDAVVRRLDAAASSDPQRATAYLLVADRPAMSCRSRARWVDRRKRLNRGSKRPCVAVGASFSITAFHVI